MSLTLSPDASPASPASPSALAPRAHHQVLVVGGGTAGLTVAARLRRARRDLDIAVVEPSDKHYYQPAWTLVGAGDYQREDTVRNEDSLLPDRVERYADRVVLFEPERNSVVTADGTRIAYDYLVVAAGIQVNWNAIPGLRENLGRNGVCSNYSYDSVAYTWECIRNFRGGSAIFTQPGTPIKCGGAPQKIMYLADDHFRKSGVRDKSHVVFASAMPNIFPVPHYAPAMEGVIRRKGIETRFKHDLVEIRGEAREAVFHNLDTGEDVTLPYAMLHVTPPMSAPDFIKASPLADAAGWVEVDKHTLRHPRFPNIFSLGDCSSAPTSKTGAAVRKQAPVVVENLLAVMDGEEPGRRYDGYTSCPLVTGYGRLVLAEFNYDKEPAETFPFDQRKERWSMYVAKKRLLPLVYWQGMLKGRM